MCFLLYNQIRIVQQKIHNIKEKRPFFWYDLKGKQYPLLFQSRHSHRFSSSPRNGAPEGPAAAPGDGGGHPVRVGRHGGREGGRAGVRARGAASHQRREVSEKNRIFLNPLLPSVLNIGRLTKILISIKEGIVKKISCPEKRRNK